MLCSCRVGGPGKRMLAQADVYSWWGSWGVCTQKQNVSLNNLHANREVSYSVHQGYFPSSGAITALIKSSL